MAHLETQALSQAANGMQRGRRRQASGHWSRNCETQSSPQSDATTPPLSQVLKRHPTACSSTGTLPCTHPCKANPTPWLQGSGRWSAQPRTGRHCVSNGAGVAAAEGGGVALPARLQAQHRGRVGGPGLAVLDGIHHAAATEHSPDEEAACRPVSSSCGLWE